MGVGAKLCLLIVKLGTFSRGSEFRYLKPSERARPAIRHVRLLNIGTSNVDVGLRAGTGRRSRGKFLFLIYLDDYNNIEVIIVVF